LFCPLFVFIFFTFAMKDSRSLIIVLILFIVVLFGVSLVVKAQKGETNIASRFIPTPSPAPVALTIGKKTLLVKVAKTEAELKQGLSGTASLTDDEGMLFDFGQQDTSRTFWMKGMLIPIDIIWINDGKVAQIDKSVPAPAPGTEDAKLTLYPSHDGVDYVLEVASGFSDRHSIKIGTVISLPSTL
jgi:uncharacterized membrane protein (UPF0127 family)